MGSVVKIKNGSDHKHLNEGMVPVYGSGGIMRFANEASHLGPSVLIPRKGSLKNLFYVEGPFWNVDTIFHTELTDDAVHLKYIFHFLSTIDFEALNVAGGVPSLTQSQLNKIVMPFPALSLQLEIVDTLDKFDALVNDISIGLPAEIAARRKQYEYYRNQLLSFDEVPA